MSEGKRIEGQMYLRGSMGWVVALVILLALAGGTLLVGWLTNRMTSAMAMAAQQAIAGGGGTGGGAFAVPGTGGAWVGGLPPAGTGSVPVSSVSWPVAADAPFREHWEKQRPGTGTLHAWYMDPASRQYWRLSSAISIPIKGEDRYVLVVHVPRNELPADAQFGQLWVCAVGQSPVGDIVPLEETVRVRAALDGGRLKHLWEKGFPEKLVKDLVDGANGTGSLSSSPGGAYSPLVNIDAYFAVAAEEEAAGEDGDEMEGE